MADTIRCFVCGAIMTKDEATKRYICSSCGNTENTVYDSYEQSEE